MNRVQTMTHKHHRVENQVKKPSQVREHPVSPAGTPRCALARPGARMGAVSWPGPRPCRGKGPVVSQALVVVSQRLCRTPRVLPPVPQLPTPAPAHPARLLRARCAPSAVSWAQCRRHGRIVAVCARRHGRIVACLATQCPTA